MRLLTHNVLHNNAAAAQGKGSPLIITATEVRVDEPNSSDSGNEQRQIQFVKGMLAVLDWGALLQGAKAMGLDTLPPSVTPELAKDESFLRALYHVLMNVHLVNGMLTCPVTGREFPVTDGIVNMMLEENECE